MLDWTTRTLAGFEKDDAEEDEDSLDGAFLEEWVMKHGSTLIRAKQLLDLTTVPEQDGVRWGLGQLGPYLKKNRDKWLPLDDGKREVLIERHEKRYRLRARSR